MTKKYIYKIENTINGKIYIGQTTDPHRREREHFRNTPSYRDRKRNKVLYKAMDKYGMENFTFEIIEKEIENYNERERYWIKYYNCIVPNGYNMTEGGEEPPVFKKEEHPMALHNQQEIDKIIDKLQNTQLTTQEIAKIYNYNISSIQRINCGLLWYDENLTYPLRKETTYAFLDERAKNVIYDLQYTKLTQKEIGIKYNLKRSAVTAINTGANHHQDNIDYPIRKSSTVNRPVIMLDIDTEEELMEFPSIKAANRYLGHPNGGSISKYLNKGGQSAYGYKWKYKD